MKTRFTLHFLLALVLTLVPVMSILTADVNAATVVHYLPFSSELGPIQVNATGLLYKQTYIDAGLTVKELAETANCNTLTNKNSFCYGYLGEFHLKDGYSSRNRGAIDFGLVNGKQVLASADGYVNRVVISNSVVNYVEIKHADGTYSYYAHLQTINVRAGQDIKRGTLLGKVGIDYYVKDGKQKYYQNHLHYALWNGQAYKSGNSEKPVQFADTDVQRHNGIVRPTDGNPYTTDQRYKNKYTSSNTPYNPPPPTVKFPDGSYSRLTVSLASVSLTVCSPGLSGKTVYATNHRGPAYGYQSKIWRYSLKATSGCVTFYDMDGAGNTFDNVVYYTVASLAPISDSDAAAKRTSCWVTTNHVQLCDGKSR